MDIKKEFSLLQKLEKTCLEKIKKAVREKGGSIVLKDEDNYILVYDAFDQGPHEVEVYEIHLDDNDDLYLTINNEIISQYDVAFDAYAWLYLLRAI